MTSERDLRQALGAIADLALDPEPLRSGLQAQLRAHRQRRALLIAGSSVVGAAAAGVPAMLWLTRNPPAPFVGESGQLHLRPGWLPDGVAACLRTFDRTMGLYEGQVFGSAEYIATLKDQQTFASEGRYVAIIVDGITVTGPSETPSDAPSAAPTSAPNTDVKGVPASLTTSEDGASVSWPLAGGLTAIVGAQRWDDIGEAREIVMRVARSLIADGRASAEVAMRFGPLPTEATPDFSDQPQFIVYGTRTDWVQRLVRGRFTAQLTPNDPNQPTLDEQVTVRGRPGTASIGGGNSEPALLVRLDDGRWLYASYYLPFEKSAESLNDLVRIVDEMTIGPNPDLSWLGRRV